MKCRRKTAFFKGGGKNIAILGMSGLFAGLCNGLLGAGGGVLLVLVLSKLLPKDTEGARSVYANALVVMFLLSCLTFWRYISFGTSVNVDEQGGIWLLMGAVVGGLLGGVFLGRLKAGGAGKLFAALTMISGILMIFA